MNQQLRLIPARAGDCLKTLRLECDLALEDVAAAIKLDVRLLEDLEEGRVPHLARIYRDGYIKSYARYLGMPEDKIAELLSSADEADPEVHNIFASPTHGRRSDKWLRATSYVLASLLIGTLAWQFTHEAVRLSQKGSNLQSTPQDAAIDSEYQPAPQQVDTVEASIAPLRVLHDNAAGATDPAEQAWQATTRTEVPEGESSLHISVSADSWVEISDASGKELEMDLLRGGSDKFYHGMPPFRILVGRASAVQLSIDGEIVDLAARSRDDVAQFFWPQELQVKTQ